MFTKIAANIPCNCAYRVSNIFNLLAKECGQNRLSSFVHETLFREQRTLDYCAFNIGRH